MYFLLHLQYSNLLLQIFETFCSRLTHMQILLLSFNFKVEEAFFSLKHLFYYTFMCFL